MPDPANFEDKDSFMSACVPKAIDEGHSQEQAVAMCSSMWEDRGVSDTSVRSERVFSLERGEIDMETGRFPMVLATSGEASDGDILNIAGSRFGQRVPLQNSHWNDTRETLGSISNFKRDLASTPNKLRSWGQIELDGPLADVRRDLAHMVSQGHIGAVSVRWEPVKYTRRVNLPENHPAFVDSAREQDPRKLYGYYHDEWRVLEGSLVAVPADREAIIGRSQETQGVVSTFWRGMASRLERGEPARVEFDLPDSIARHMAVFAAQARDLLSQGAEIDDLIAEIVLSDDSIRQDRALTHADILSALETLDKANIGTRAPDADAQRVEAPPAVAPPVVRESSPSYGLQDLARDLRLAVAASDARLRDEMRAMLDAVTGKVR